MLPISRNLTEVLQRVHGRWFRKIELLVDSAEHVRDYKEGLQEGTQTPASSLEFVDDGAVKLAATTQQDVAFAAGTAKFNKLVDDLKTNLAGLLLYELEAGRDELQVTRAKLKLSRSRCRQWRRCLSETFR